MELNLPVVGFGGYHGIPRKSVLPQLLLSLVGVRRELLCRLVFISRVPRADVSGFGVSGLDGVGCVRVWCVEVWCVGVWCVGVGCVGV